MFRHSGLARVVPVVAAAALLVAACGGDGSTDSAPPAATDAPAAETSNGTDDAVAPIDGVPELLQFTAPLVGGGEFNAASTAGTPTAFWFWAPT